MEDNNRQNRRSTGMRSAYHNQNPSAGKYSGSDYDSQNGRTSSSQYNNARRSSSSERTAVSKSSGRTDVSRPSEKKPLTREQRLARQRKREMERKKAIAKLVLAAVIIIGIVIVIVAIANGAKNNNPKETTAVVANETTKEAATDANGQAITNENGETVAAGETTTSPETTTSGIQLIDNDGSSAVRPVNWNGKTVYITFDDGPSAVTTANLEVLDRYGVKATFFCLGFASPEAYQEIVNRGHALAAHSYSHDYDTIYANLDNFAADVQAIKKVLEDATGTEVFLYRFPGGSNNQVHSCPSMTELANYIESIGMKYVDWNADSTDAEYTTADVDVLIAHSLADIEFWGDETDQETIILLMHDSENKTTGTASLEYIIPYLLEKGYGFDRISRDTPDIHFVLPD